MSVRVIISASSDIGMALAYDWEGQDIDVIGTFRQKPKREFPKTMQPVRCDLNFSSSRIRAIAKLRKLVGVRGWDVAVLASGTTMPIGRFGTLSWEDWASSLQVNLLGQVQVLHGIIDMANTNAQVIFFAGGGMNGAVNNYSAYTLSKVAGTKLCELLGSEYPELKFTSLGPGWVKTKIHQETLSAGQAAGENFNETLKRLDNDKFFPIQEVVSRVNWIISQPAEVVSGRNFSAVNDPFFNGEFPTWLKQDGNRLKLRRFGNQEAERL